MKNRNSYTILMIIACLGMVAVLLFTLAGINNLAQHAARREEIKTYLLYQHMPVWSVLPND